LSKIGVATHIERSITVRIKSAIYVLHVLQKKSRHGIATPKVDVELIRERLKTAEAVVRE